VCDPARRYAACACATAMQPIICKHQVAWLVALAPLDSKAEAERLCVLMLGTRLGFTGSTMEDISSLAHALHDLALSTASITSSGIPLAAALPILSPAGPPAVSPDAPPLILQAAPPGCKTLQNHKREMQQILQESLQMLEHEDGAEQLSLMLQQKAALARILQTTTVAAKLAHELGTPVRMVGHVVNR
jgi:hypothetical protein